MSILGSRSTGMTTRHDEDEHDGNYYDGGPCRCGEPGIRLEDMYDREAVEHIGLVWEELCARHARANAMQGKNR